MNIFKLNKIFIVLLLGATFWTTAFCKEYYIKCNYEGEPSYSPFFSLVIKNNNYFRISSGVYDTYFFGRYSQEVSPFDFNELISQDNFILRGVSKHNGTKGKVKFKKTDSTDTVSYDLNAKLKFIIKEEDKTHRLPIYVDGVISTTGDSLFLPEEDDVILFEGIISGKNLEGNRVEQELNTLCTLGIY